MEQQSSHAMVPCQGKRSKCRDTKILMLWFHQKQAWADYPNALLEPLYGKVKRSLLEQDQ